MEEGGFDREYGSVWAGNAQGAFFDSEKFDKYRQLNLPEHQYNNRVSSKTYYVMGVDIGRFDDNTEVVIIKATPTNNQTWVKQVVNISTLEPENAQFQCIKLKKIFQKYKCDAAVVDGNGVGAGFVDNLVLDSVDPDTGEILGGWGVINDSEEKGKRYKDLYTENTIHNAMYIMKANTALNSEMYNYFKFELNNGRMRFLIDESVAKNKLMAQAQGQKMSAIQRAEYLLPYVETSLLKAQIRNLICENEGANIILKQSSKKIKKDKFSALIYGLYWCKLKEDKRGKRKKRSEEHTSELQSP